MKKLSEPQNLLSDTTIVAQSQFHLQVAQAKAVAMLRLHGPLSRTDIADATGYSRSTITSVIQQLAELGIIQELGDGESNGGRRSRILSFRDDFGYLLGIDMGATSADIAFANFAGRILEQTSLSIDVRQGPQAVLARVREAALALAQRSSVTPERVVAIGIGVPGPVDFAAGMLIAPPIMPGWDAYPVRSFFQRDFANAVVIVDNDVNVMALGERRAGAGMHHRHFIFVKVGTGIGAGVICNGEVHRGSDGSAGDIGHICADQNGPICHCGNVGCLEAIAAGPSLAARAMEAARSGRSAILAKRMEHNDGLLSAVDVGRAAAEGDLVSNEIIQDTGRILGEVLAGLVNFFNPSLILVGGGVSAIGHQFLAAIRRGVLHRSLPLATRHLRIDISPMGPNAGVIGALALAMEHVFTVDT